MESQIFMVIMVPNIYGVFSPNNSLGGKSHAYGWAIPSQNLLYIFGGSQGGARNDIWAWDLSNSQRAWVGGEMNGVGLNGIHPQKGSCGPANITYPGGRYFHAVFIDSNDVNRLYLLGGWGRGESTTNIRYLSDLWYFDRGNNEFCFISGDKEVNYNGNYDSLGSYTSANQPRGRSETAFWTRHVSINESQFCIFGGRVSWDTPHTLSDLWCWSTEKEMWIWLSGTNEIIRYPTVTSYFSSSTYPSSRRRAAATMINNDLVFLYGGSGFSIPNCAAFLINSECYGSLTDLWVYSHILNQWKLVSTANSLDINVLTSIGASSQVFDDDNIPTARNRMILEYNSVRNTILMGFGITVIQNERRSESVHNNILWEFDYSDYIPEGSIPSCNGVLSNDPSVCSSNGVCDENGICDCFIGYNGTNCEFFYCFGVNAEEACGSQFGVCERVDDCNCTTTNENGKKIYRDGYSCNLEFDNSPMVCIEKCYQDNSKKVDQYMKLSNQRKNEFDRDNFIGSRVKGAIFSSGKDDIIWIFGGWRACVISDCSNYCSDMWQFNAQTSQYRVHPTAGSDPETSWESLGVFDNVGEYLPNIYPSARVSVTSSIHNERIVFIYGGRGINLDLKNDLWAFDLVIEMWMLIIE